MPDIAFVPRDAIAQPEVATPLAATDQELLQRFIARREDAAFARLVERHGRTVWGVCRRVLGQVTEARLCTRSLARHIDAVDCHVTRIGIQKARRDAQQCGLSRTVASDEENCLAGIHLERDATDSTT